MVIRCVLLVATDGLYDMLSNERAVGVAFDHWGDPASAAVELVKEAGEYNDCVMGWDVMCCDVM
jgi:serine/threonine protein phosphatase PrpC